MTDVDLAQVMSSAAEDAVREALSVFGVALDYSEGSIQAVEKILGRIHDSRPKGLLRLFRRGPSGEEIWAHALSLGAYVGEVMRRQWGGAWEPPLPDIGKAFVTLHLSWGTVWPTAKALKRLLNGAEDNVWLYYRVLKADHGHGAEAAAPE